MGTPTCCPKCGRPVPTDWLRAQGMENGQPEPKTCPRCGFVLDKRAEW